MLAVFLKLNIPRSNLSDSVLCCELAGLTCSLLRRLIPAPKLFFRHSAKRDVLRSPFGLSLPLRPLPFNWLPLLSLPCNSPPLLSLVQVSRDSRFPWSLSLKCWKVNLIFSVLLFRRLLWLPGSVTSGRGSGGGTSGGLKDNCGLKVGSLFFTGGSRAGHAHAPWHPLLQ